MLGTGLSILLTVSTILWRELGQMTQHWSGWLCRDPRWVSLHAYWSKPTVDYFQEVPSVRHLMFAETFLWFDHEKTAFDNYGKVQNTRRWLVWKHSFHIIGLTLTGLCYRLIYRTLRRCLRRSMVKHCCLLLRRTPQETIRGCWHLSWGREVTCYCAESEGFTCCDIYMLLHQMKN